MDSFEAFETQVNGIIKDFKSKKSEEDLSIQSYSKDVVNLFESHKMTKKAADCDILMSTFKTLVDCKLLVEADLAKATSIVATNCLKYDSKKRLDYALAILLQQIQDNECKKILYKFITTCSKEHHYAKIKNVIDKFPDEGDCLSAKNRLAFMIVNTRASNKESSFSSFFKGPSSQSKHDGGGESATPAKSQPDLDKQFSSSLTVLSKFKAHFIDVVEFISIKKNIPIIIRVRDWLTQNPSQKPRMILEICCMLFENDKLDKYSLSLFDQTLNHRYLHYETYWKYHEKFKEACNKFNNQFLLDAFESRKNDYHSREIDVGDSSGEDDQSTAKSTQLDGSIEDAKSHIKTLLQKSLADDVEAFKELKVFYELHAKKGKKSTVLIGPEICLAIAQIIDEKPTLFQIDVEPEELRTRAKDLFEEYLKGTEVREGLLVDIADCIYRGEILGGNLFLARHLLESCKINGNAKHILTDHGKMLLAKMCFKREGGLEDLDQAIDLLNSVTPEVLYRSAESLYILGECLFVKKRLGVVCNSPEDLWKHAVRLGYEKATMAGKILSKYSFSYFQKDDIAINATINTSLRSSENELDNPDSDYEDDEQYRGSDSTTTADTDLTTDIINRIRSTTIGKLLNLMSKNETELCNVKKSTTKKKAPIKKKIKQETTAEILENKILAGYADIVYEYNPQVRSAAKQINAAIRPDYEALLHHAAKGDLFSHLRRSEVSYQLAQLRGMHCFNHLWPEEKVREFKQKVLDPDHPLKKYPVYSAAVKEIAGVNSFLSV